MKTKIIALAAAILVPASLALAASPKVIAHRGHWQPEGSAQNSIRSLVKADSVGCYATEFDVWLTSDGVPVVNHDRDINGVVIEENDFATVSKQKLPNGESISTLEEYLQTAAGLKVRLVFELKEQTSRAMERKAVKDAVEMVKKYGLENRTDFITFSRDAFQQFANQAPEVCGVYYLTGDYVPSQIKYSGGEGIDYHLGALKKHPEWIAQCHDMGLLVNAWTIDKEEDMQWCIDHGVDFITTNRPEVLQQVIKKNEK